MFHLLKEDHQQLGYFAIVAIYYLLHSSYVGLKTSIETNKLEERVVKWHNKLYPGKSLRFLIIGIFLALHINEKLIAPPSSLPYLHNLLFAIYSFAFNLYFLLFSNLLQIEWIKDWLKNRSRSL